MKKILTIIGLSVVFTAIPAHSSCPISGLMDGQTSCNIVLQGQNQTIKDKLMPNNLNQMVNPSRNTSQEFKSQPHSMPDTLKMDSNNPENNQENTPYNAACQFGVCMPGNSYGTQSNR